MGRLSHLLIHSAILERKVLTPNGAGGLLESFEAVTDSSGPLVLTCRINQAAARDIEIAAQRHAECDAIAYFDPATTPEIRINDRIVSGARSFRVVARIVPSVQSLYLKIMCEEIQ